MISSSIYSCGLRFSFDSHTSFQTVFMYSDSPHQLFSTQVTSLISISSNIRKYLMDSIILYLRTPVDMVGLDVFWESFRFTFSSSGLAHLAWGNDRTDLTVPRWVPWSWRRCWIWPAIHWKMIWKYLEISGNIWNMNEYDLETLTESHTCYDIFWDLLRGAHVV